MGIGEHVIDSNHLDWLATGWAMGPPLSGAQGLVLFHKGDYAVVTGGRFSIITLNQDTGEKTTETVTLAKGEFAKAEVETDIPNIDIFIIMEEETERLTPQESLQLKKSLRTGGMLTAGALGLLAGVVVSSRRRKG